MDWGVVRPPRLFLRIDMILRKSSSTNIAVVKLFKKFLPHFRVIALVHPKAFFQEQFLLNLQCVFKNKQKSVSTCVFANKKCFRYV